MDEQMMNEHARSNGGVQGAHHAGAHGADDDAQPAQEQGDEKGVGEHSGSESQDANKVEAGAEPETALEPVSMNDESREQQTGQQN